MKLDGRKTRAITAILKSNIDTPVNLVMVEMKKNNMPVSSALVYQIRTKLRKSQAIITNNTVNIDILKNLRMIARQVGGTIKLRQMVNLLEELEK